MRFFELWCKVTEAESENENREQEMNMTDLHDDTPSKPPSGDRYKNVNKSDENKKQSLETRKKAFHTPVFLKENKDEWANIPPQWRETLTACFVNAGLRLVVEGGTIWKA